MLGSGDARYEQAMQAAEAQHPNFRSAATHSASIIVSHAHHPSTSSSPTLTSAATAWHTSQPATQHRLRSGSCARGSLWLTSVSAHPACMASWMGTDCHGTRSLPNLITKSTLGCCRGWVGFDVPVSHRIVAGCDVMLMPSRFEPCGLNQLFAMRYGTVPVAHATGGLRDTIQDFNPFAEGGCLHERLHGELWGGLFEA